MTEADLLARLAAYLSAEAAILAGAQEYTVGAGSTARRLTRANLGEVQQAIKEIRAELGVLQGARAGRRITYLRPAR